MGTITKIIGREILDSRGNPTVEATVVFDNGASGTAAVPSGASTGTYEAVELRDQDPRRYHGMGVQRAVTHVSVDIARALQNDKVYTQKELDETMLSLDKTANKGALGANAMLAVSLAYGKAAAAESKLPLYQYLGGEGAVTLPVPMMNIMNGGVHVANELDFQEFMIIPMPKAAEGKQATFREALRMGVEVYHSLKSVLKAKNLSTAVGDEGGFAPDVYDADEALALLSEGVKRAGYEPGKDIFFAIDAAASELHQADSGMYFFPGETKKRCEKLATGDHPVGEDNGKVTATQPDTIGTHVSRTTDEMIEYYTALVDKYPIVSIEDPLDEEDMEGWQKITEVLGKRVQIVGDDFFVTNPDRLKRGISMHAANAILIKPNQIGTLSETMETISIAKSAGYPAIISHRSGETEDTTIADLVVAMNTGQIKTGAPCRGERTAKYNRLLQIEEELGERAQYGHLPML